MDQHAAPPRLHTGSVRFMKGPDGKHSRVQRIDAKDLDLNLLVMAKQEYTSFLHSILRDKVKGGLLTQYNTAVDEAPSANLAIKTYQKILKETPLWNQNIVKKETERILGEYRAMFPNLIALIYVAKVKIMASVRVTKGTSYVALSIPSPEAFVHQVYIECAHILYENPTLCHLQSSDVRLHFERNDVLQNVVRRGTEEALSIMLPVKDILSEYLNNTMLENSVFSMGDDEQERDEQHAHEQDEESSDEGDKGREEESDDAPKHVEPVGDDFLKQALVRPIEETRTVHMEERPHHIRPPPAPAVPVIHADPAVHADPAASADPAVRADPVVRADPAVHAVHANPANPANPPSPHARREDHLDAGSDYFEDDFEDDETVQDYNS
jgi:hypothetical protein